MGRRSRCHEATLCARCAPARAGREWALGAGGRWDRLFSVSTDGWTEGEAQGASLAAAGAGGSRRAPHSAVVVTRRSPARRRRENWVTARGPELSRGARWPGGRLSSCTTLLSSKDVCRARPDLEEAAFRALLGVARPPGVWPGPRRALKSPGRGSSSAARRPSPLQPFSCRSALPAPPDPVPVPAPPEVPGRRQRDGQRGFEGPDTPSQALLTLTRVRSVPLSCPLSELQSWGGVFRNIYGLVFGVWCTCSWQI